uniref:Uncharacterized protein n=1 Tax=Gracilinema caldarium TaxID=215591 RepID=A0A7C3IGV7_9SPIR
MHIYILLKQVKEKYFDTVNHDLLIQMVRETVSDEAVITMIRKFLESGIMEEGLVSQIVYETVRTVV